MGSLRFDHEKQKTSTNVERGLNLINFGYHPPHSFNLFFILLKKNGDKFSDLPPRYIKLRKNLAKNETGKRGDENSSSESINKKTKQISKLFVSEHRCRDQLTTPTRSQSSEDEQNLETMQPMQTNLKEKLGIAGQFDGDQRKNVSKRTACEWRGVQTKCETASGFGCVGVWFFRLYVASEGEKLKGEWRARIRKEEGKVVGEKGTIGKGWMITALFGKELSLSLTSSNLGSYV